VKSSDKKAFLKDALKDPSIRAQILAESTESLVELSNNPHTEDAYLFAIKEFTQDYHGQLPCDDEALAGYLGVFSAIHKPATLELRKSMITKWHKINGHPDPADSDLVRRVMVGMRKRFGNEQKQARSLDIDQLEVVVEYLDQKYADAETIAHDKTRLGAQLKAKRDKAFLLLGYWYGLRSDSLLIIEMKHVSIERTSQGRKLSLYQPHSKTDKQAHGRKRSPLREMGFLCPVAAMDDWLTISNIENEQGPVFSKVSRWGKISEEPLHRSSVNRMMREYFEAAGLDAKFYSSHSMRRGLANFLVAQKFTDKELMEWIGWSDYRSALRYQDSRESISNLALNRYIEEKYGPCEMKALIEK